MWFLKIIVKNAENWHCPGTLILHINLLTKALKIEGNFVQHFLVISHFTSTVKSVMALKSHSCNT